jgi:predicted deacylase
MTRNSEISIGGTRIAPGERTELVLPVADLYTTTAIGMPVKVIAGRKAGPTLFVSAAIHGDELNGVEIIRRMLRRKIMRSIRGTLIAVPVVNVHGFLDQSRYLPDRRDLNRSFPGSARGSIAARLADLFVKEILSKADFGIDLHTGAINRSNLPQVRANLDDAKTLEIAEAFGAPVIIDANLRDGSLRACAADIGVPILIYEAGEALRFDETSIRAGLRGIFNVMRHIGMLPESSRKRLVEPVVARSTRWVRAGRSGIVNMAAKLGSRVGEGDRLATISDPIGQHEDHVTAPFDGIVIGRNNLPLAHEGDALIHLGSFSNVPMAEDVVEAFTTVHEENG